MAKRKVKRTVKKKVAKQVKALGPAPLIVVSMVLSVVAVFLSELMQQHGWKLGWCKLYLMLSGNEHRWLSWHAAAGLEKAAIVMVGLSFLIAVLMLFGKSSKSWSVGACLVATYALWICWTAGPIIPG